MKIKKLCVVATFVLGAVCCISAQNLIPFQNEKGKWGYADDKGLIVIKEKYDKVTSFVDGRALVVKDGKTGYIAPDGSEIIKVKYTEFGPWNEKGYAKVAVGGQVKDGVLNGAKYGYIDRDGNDILKPEYDEISTFTNGAAIIVKGGKYGFITPDYRILVKPDYSAAGVFNEQGYTWVAKGGKMAEGKITGAKFGIIDKAGNIVIKPDYTAIGTFDKKLTVTHPIIARVMNSKEGRDKLKQLSKEIQKGQLKTSLVNSMLDDKKASLKLAKENAMRANNKFIESAQAAFTPAERLILAEQQDYGMLGYTLIDGTPRTMLDLTVDDTHLAVSKSKLMYEGEFSFDSRVWDKNGIVDIKTGQVLIKPGVAGNVFLPTEGLYPAVKRAGKYFQFNFLTAAGKPLMKKWIKGTGIIPFENGTAVISDNEGDLIVNSNGDICSSTYELILPQTDGNYIARTSTGYGLVSGSTGKEVTPLNYSMLLPASSGLYMTKTADGKCGYLNAGGQFAIDPVYADARSFRAGTATVKTADGWGVITPANSTVVDFKWEDAKPFTLPDPTLCWVKNQGAWQCINVADGTKAFDGTYADAYNFDQNNNALVVNELGLYGVINDKGHTVIPMRLSNPVVVSLLFDQMTADGATSVSDIDAHRFNINNNPERNSFRLSTVIDNSMWEY